MEAALVLLDRMGLSPADLVAFGFATAQAYAGHEDHGRGGKAMATYIRAGLPEVAAALTALTGEDHPLATSPPSRSIPISSPPE